MINGKDEVIDSDEVNGKESLHHDFIKHSDQHSQIDADGPSSQ